MAWASCPRAASAGITSRQHQAPWQEPWTRRKAAISAVPDPGKEAAEQSGEFRGPVHAGQMAGAPDQLEPGALDERGRFAHEVGRGGAILRPGNHQRRQRQSRGGRVEIRAGNRGHAAEVASTGWRVTIVRQPVISTVSRKDLANQRSIVASATASIPPARTAAIHSAQTAGVAILVAVFDSTVARTRSSRFTARPWAIMPPRDSPTKTQSLTPSVSRSRSASRTRAPIA